MEQAKGTLDYAQTQLDNTVIKAPIDRTILERNVEQGEFVTTGFVGDKGAKGYVVSLADLDDLEVELDINQNDFAKLGSRQPAIVTTDAYPDRKYKGYIEEIAPEANRQKATVQVKVRVEKPDGYLRPEMNASVAFVASGDSGKLASQAKPHGRCARRGRARSRRVRGGGWQGCAPKRASADWWRRRYRGPAGRLKDGQKVRPGPTL